MCGAEYPGPWLKFSGSLSDFVKNLATGACGSGKALLRWYRPTGGLRYRLFANSPFLDMPLNRCGLFRGLTRPIFLGLGGNVFEPAMHMRIVAGGDVESHPRRGLQVRPEHDAGSNHDAVV